MAWDVEVTDEFAAWYLSLSDKQRAAIAKRIDLLEQDGPTLKRPAVGAIKGSRFDPQMKELRADSGGQSLRVLFIFDPKRTAILLLGGNKTGQWNRWYRAAITEADDLYDIYLDEKGLR
jgi:hypothetical protein